MMVKRQFTFPCHEGIGPAGRRLIRLQLMRFPRGSVTPAFNHMLSKIAEGILIEAQGKEFSDGGGGFFCTVVQKNKELITFWAKRELEHLVRDVHAVDIDEPLDPAFIEKFKLTGKQWQGKVKWSLTE